MAEYPLPPALQALELELQRAALTLEHGLEHVSKAFPVVRPDDREHALPDHVSVTGLDHVQAGLVHVQEPTFPVDVLDALGHQTEQEACTPSQGQGSDARAGSFHGRTHRRGQERVGRLILEDVVVQPQPKALDGELFAARGREEDHGARGPALLDCP